MPTVRLQPYFTMRGARSGHFVLLDNPNNTWPEIQIMKIIMYFSPLRYIYSQQTTLTPISCFSLTVRDLVLQP
jgi:hypothetical protein